MGGSEATVDRVYDYWLGGRENLRVDRELGKAIEERFPSVRDHVQAARKFCLRAASWCAGYGIERFACTGVAGWKPGLRNVHDAAREMAPRARVAYVHRGREAHAWARVLLGGRGLATARADVNCPASLLAAGPVAALLGDGEPVALLLAMTLHFAPPEQAAEQVALYADALPRGSALALCVALPDDSPEADDLIRMFTPARVYRHTAADVAGWVKAAGLELAPPGV